jgi:hypothetical protein
MTTFLLSLLCFALVMGGMAIGVMITGRRLRGSCGGMASGACVCKAERLQPQDCPRRRGGKAPAGQERSLPVVHVGPGGQADA